MADIMLIVIIMKMADDDVYSLMIIKMEADSGCSSKMRNIFEIKSICIVFCSFCTEKK